MSRWAGPLLATLRLDLRRWRRQRLAALTALVAPAAVAVIVTGALGGEPRVDTTWAVVDEDGGPAASAFFDRALTHPAVAEVATARRLDRDAAVRALDGNDVSAAIVLPSGLSEALAAGDAPAIEVMAPRTDSVGTDIARLVVDQFRVRAWAESTAVGAGAEPPDDETWPLTVAVRSATGRDLDAAAHYGPAIGMFFVLLALGFAIHNHVADRESDVLDRLTTAGVPAWTVVAGRVLAAVTVGGLSLAVTAATMGVVFGRSWGPPIPVVVLVLAVLVCYAGMAAVLAAVLRTSAQAQVATAAVGFVLALGSGSLGPPGTERPPVAVLVPTTYALDAFAELGVAGAGIGAVAGYVVLLALVGLGLLAVSAPLARTMR